MVVITEEYTLAVSADRMWKVFSSGEALHKACAGIIDAVNVEGDGGLGTVTTLTLSAAVAAASGGGLLKGRVVARDDEARVLKSEMLEGGRVRGQLKSLVNGVKLEADGDDACVAKLTIEYEKIDGGVLASEDQAEVVQGYLGLLKKVEAYLAANPTEYV